MQNTYTACHMLLYGLQMREYSQQQRSTCTYCTRKHSEVPQSHCKMNPQATASILLPSLTSKHQLIDKIKNKKKDLWVLV